MRIDVTTPKHLEGRTWPQPKVGSVVGAPVKQAQLPAPAAPLEVPHVVEGVVVVRKPIGEPLPVGSETL
jgi:hypothetical protein